MRRNSSETKDVYVIEANELEIYQTKATITDQARKIIKTANGVRVTKPLWTVHKSTACKLALRMADRRIIACEKQIQKLAAKKRKINDLTYKINII